MQDQIPAKKPEPPDQNYLNLLEYSLLIVFITIASIFVMTSIDTSLRAVWLNVTHALATAHLLASALR